MAWLCYTFPMEPRLVVITDMLFEDFREEEEVFKGEGVVLEAYKGLKRLELIEKVRRADALLVNMAPIDRELIDALECCKVISRYGTGYDNVDSARARERNIPLGIIPDYCTVEVAEHAAALLLAGARGILQAHRTIHQGAWRAPLGYPLHRIDGSVLGILGYGKTGQALHQRLKGFGFRRTLVYSRSVAEGVSLPGGAEGVSLETLLKEADYLSIHLPLTEETKGLLTEERLMSMKEGAVLINTSRGGVLDEIGLYRSLTEGPLRGACLDVFAQEPLPRESPLRNLNSVIFTDHRAYYSEEAVGVLKRRTAENALTALKTGSPLWEAP